MPKPDSQHQPEIEIAPEMIEAGVDAFLEMSID